VAAAYTDAVGLLSTHFEPLERLAKALAAEEQLDRRQIEELLADLPPASPMPHPHVPAAAPKEPAAPAPEPVAARPAPEEAAQAPAPAQSRPRLRDLPRALGIPPVTRPRAPRPAPTTSSARASAGGGVSLSALVEGLRRSLQRRQPRQRPPLPPTGGV